MKDVLKSSFPYYAKKMWIFVICAIMGLMRMVILLIEPQIISLIVDRVINPALGNEPVKNASIFSFLIEDIPSDNLWLTMGVLVATFIGFMILYFVLFYARWNIAHYFSIGCENNMRKDVLNKINSFGPDILKDYSVGDLITIVNSDTGRIRNMYVAAIPFILDAVFYICVALFFLSKVSYSLMVVPILVIGIYIVVTRGFLRTFNKMYDEMWEKNSALNTETQESIYGIRTIKSYAREEFRDKRFEKKAKNLRDFYCKFGNKRYKYFLLYDSLDQVVLLVSMGLSIYLASQFKMTTGEYSAFLTYMLMVVGQFVDLIFNFADMQQYAISGKRLFGLLKKKNDILAKYGTLSVNEKPSIEVKNATVEIDGNKLIDSVNISIPFGKKLGIMGKTGSGKSVFIKAIQAFTEITDGEIIIDGRDMHEYDRTEIARAYSYAMQEVFLFSNTIISNIAYYNPDADTERIMECGKLAEADEFVMKFPEGYDTIVGEKGFGLSGGQKQRVAIARALLKDAPVIVLDDCTSALDVETESKIFKNLHSHVDDKTLIMATHRAAAIKDFDEIIFFEDGKIAERGTFDELMKLNGRYADIYNRQVEGEVFVSE